MSPILTEALGEARVLDAPTLTGGLQDARTSAGGRSTTSLTDEIKAFIVRGLARYETPSQVARAVNATFGIEVSRQLIYKHDPVGSKPPAERWIELHAMTRAKFLAELAEIGVAQKVVRLWMLDRFAREAEDNDEMAASAAFLEQAAKECGGIYEGRRAPLRSHGAPGDAP